MELKKLLSHLPNADCRELPDTEIDLVTCDSRQVKAGSVFVAIRGTSQDGNWYVPEAVKQGVSAIVTERSMEPISKWKKY